MTGDLDPTEETELDLAARVVPILTNAAEQLREARVSQDAIVTAFMNATIQEALRDNDATVVISYLRNHAMEMENRLREATKH